MMTKPNLQVLCQRCGGDYPGVANDPVGYACNCKVFYA